MSNKSENVKKWRQRTKERIVKAMGGECQICGYCKTVSAMDLHHIDPNEKDFTFGKVTANPMSWDKIVKELRKCILLCCRCHREVHSEDAVLPEDYCRFDESFEKYESLASKKEIDSCPVCGNDKPKKQITCSVSCGGRHRYNVDWEKYDLKKMNKTMTKTKMAEIIGVSQQAISKRMKKYDLC
jgi:hypothetical protein